MIEAAQQALAFAEGHTEADLDHDRMLNFAMVRAVEIVGEAAARISKVTLQRYPEVQWSVIIGMRHRVAHGYLDIQHDILWNTVTRDYPRLLPQLHTLFNDLEP